MQYKWLLSTHMSFPTGCQSNQPYNHALLNECVTSLIFVCWNATANHLGPPSEPLPCSARTTSRRVYYTPESVIIMLGALCRGVFEVLKTISMTLSRVNFRPATREATEMTDAMVRWLMPWSDDFENEVCWCCAPGMMVMTAVGKVGGALIQNHVMR